MKKFIFGLVLGAILVTPISVSAWNKKQMMQPIYGSDCHSPWAAEEEAKHPDDYDCSVTISVFDDSGNKCYLAKGSNGTGLSCVRMP